jgi:hypothetical protein
MLSHATGELLLFILHGHGFKVFGLEDLAAIETFQVFHAVSSGDYLGTGVITSRLHNQRLDETYFIQVHALVKPPVSVFPALGRFSPCQGLQFW